MLAIARIAGETAPLLFTALGLNYLSTNLLQPMASLTYQIYYYAGSPYEEWHDMAWAATLVLVTMILALKHYCEDSDSKQGSASMTISQ
jgi:phosphate transport system permease protein